jgi:urea transporter
LIEHPEGWPWWLLGGLVALIGLLLLSAPGAVLVLVGVAIASVPLLRQQLDDCKRVPS